MNKFSKGIVSLSLVAALTTGYVGIMNFTEGSAHAFNAGSSTAVPYANRTQSAVRLTDMKVPKKGEVGQDVTINKATATKIDGTALRAEDGEEELGGKIAPTILNIYGEDITKGALAAEYDYVNNPSSDVVTFKPVEKGESAYTVYYEYTEKILVPAGTMIDGKATTADRTETRVLARSEDFKISVTADSYGFKFDTNVRYRASSSTNDIYPLIPTIMKTGESFVVPMPRVLNTNGNVLFRTNKAIELSDSDIDITTLDASKYEVGTGPDEGKLFIKAGVVVSIEDFFNDATYKTEEDMLTDKDSAGVYRDNFDLVTPSGVEFYNALSKQVVNYDITNLHQDYATDEDKVDFDYVTGVTDRYGREVETIKITIKENLTGDDWLGNYTLRYVLDDLAGVDLPDVSQMSRGYSINVRSVKEYSELTWSLNGTVPTAGVKGETITLPSRTVKNKAGEEINAYTRVWVTFIANGSTAEVNPITYQPVTNVSMAYDISDTMELKLQNSQNADGTYRIRYESFDPLNPSVAKTPVRIYDIERVTDTKRPEVQLAENYDWDQTSSLDKNDIVSGRHLLASRVGLINEYDDLVRTTGDNPPSYQGVIYIPAVYATDNVNDLKDIEITRNIYKKGSGDFVDEVNNLFKKQYAGKTAAEIQAKFPGILNVKTEGDPAVETYSLKYNKGFYIYLEDEGTYELKITAKDKQGLETTITFEFTVESFNGLEPVEDYKFVIQDTYDRGDEISFAIPTATQKVGGQTYNVSTETYYYYGAEDATLKNLFTSKLSTSYMNYNAIRSYIEANPSKFKKALRKQNDNVNLYIPTRVNETRDIYVFSVAVSSEARRISDFNRLVTTNPAESGQTAFVKTSKIVNFENSFTSDDSAPIFDAYETGKKFSTDITSNVYDTSKKEGGYDTTAKNFVDVFQNNLVRLPDVTFADNDSQFDISVLARYLTRTSDSSESDIIYETKAEGGIDNTKLMTPDQTGKYNEDNVGGGDEGDKGDSVNDYTYRTLQGGRFIPKKGAEYILSYTAKDSNGNATLISFLFEASDTEAPSITHEEASTQTMELGTQKRFKKSYVLDNGEELVNGVGGAIVELRIVSGPTEREFLNGELFIPHVADTFGFQYFARDKKGNETTSGVITVVVEDKTAPQITVNESRSLLEGMQKLIWTGDKDKGEDRVATIAAKPTTQIPVTYSVVEIPSFSASDYAGIQSRKIEISLSTGGDIEVKKLNSSGQAGTLTESDYLSSSTRYGFVPTAEGEYIIKYTAVDINNNTATETYRIIYGDSINPTVSTTQELEGKEFKVGTTVTIDFDLMELFDNSGKFTTGLGGNEVNEPKKENIQVLLYINDEPSTEYANITPDNNIIALNQTGNYRIILQVQDKAGRYGTHTINFKVVEGDNNENELDSVWVVVIIVSCLVVLGGVSAWVILGGKKGKVKRKKDIKEEASAEPNL